MIDLRYHIASLVGIFLALGLGILIGSTIVGDNLLVDQQKKMIDRLEQQFYSLRERENDLITVNNYKDQIIANYENYSQTLLPPLVKEHLVDYKIALVVSGGSDVPAGMLNALSIAGAEVASKAVILANMSLDSPELLKRVRDFYKVENDVSADVLRQYLAGSVALVITNKADPELINFLQANELIKFSGNNSIPLNGVIVLGGTNNVSSNFSASFDHALIGALASTEVKIFGVEKSDAVYSYMPEFQKNNISTIDNVNLSPGQISLVYAMEGEPGHYGIKTTAKQFMPSLPMETLKR
ncbi:MAG: copper transporter [Syntrophomonadaceae bacterium]|nr:copper transporter [Syntrophomonadaceae bacterium]